MNLLLLLLLGLLIVWAGVVTYTTWMLTHPPRRTYASAVSRGRPGDPGELPDPREFTQWTFRSRGRDLPVWDIPGDRPDGCLVVMTHGWGDSRIGALPRLGALLPYASRILAWDLPGQGLAPGICSLGTRECADLGELVSIAGRTAPGRPLVLYGWSLGAGVSIAAATGITDIAGVIAETPYRLPPTPARNVLRGRGLPHRCTLAPSFLVLRACFGAELDGQRFDRARLATSVGRPLMVLHGAEDEVCPLRDGEEIAAAAPQGRLAVVPGGSHNSLWMDADHRRASSEAVGGFLKEVLDRAGAVR